MSSKRDVSDITQATEELIRQYFEQKGWSGQKLDKPRKNAVTASDWLFSKSGVCFLCEVKTITSVRKGLFTEAHFTAFDRMLDEHFSTSIWSNTPLSVRIHSDTVYQPSLSETRNFINWLESALLMLRDDKFAYRWMRDVMPWGGKLYTTHYTFSTTAQGRESSFSVHVSTTTTGDKLEIQSYIYGDLHVDKIDDNVLKARDQLKRTAQRQSDTAIPRVVVLAFEGTNGGGIGFDWQMACKRIGELLQQYRDISTIVVMSFTNTEKYEGDDIIEWLATAASSPIVPYFVVFHNRWLVSNINQLDVSVFFDDYSVQLSPI